MVTLVTEMLELHKHLSHEKDRSGETARHADIPLTLCCILHLIEQCDMMIPGYLCKQLLHN